MPLSNIKIQRPGPELSDESLGRLPAAELERCRSHVSDGIRCQSVAQGLQSTGEGRQDRCLPSVD
jgi:hypothetical protein